MRAVLLIALVLLAPGAARAQETPRVPVIELRGTIDPASAAWIDEALEHAAEEQVPLAIVQLDTPGGLADSMRDIVQSVLGAPMPVVVYVAPDGARAASAGLFVTLASDVAAMSPGTNIGSATPVSLGGGETTEVLGRKIRNDAAAYARALAEARDRNADLAEEMVREATNVTAGEALDRNLIEVVAEDIPALLRELDGRALPHEGGRTLSTAGLVAEERPMPLQYELQQLLVNPSVAYLLLLGGLIGIALEILSPGLVGPGLFGAVALVLGLYGTAQLPVRAAGIALLLLGVGLLAAELAVASGGLLAGAGAIAVAAAGLLLYETDSDALAVSLPAAAAAGAALGAFTVFGLAKALRVRHAPARGGAGDLIGAVGVVCTPLSPEGLVLVSGERWRARTAGARYARVGERVRVEAVAGLTLHVRHAEALTDQEES